MWHGIRSFRPTNPKWIPGTIVRPTGPLYYIVRVDSGLEWKHHIDHLRENVVTEQHPTDLQSSSTEPEPDFEIPCSGDSNTSARGRGVSAEAENTGDPVPVEVLEDTRLIYVVNRTDICDIVYIIS